MLAMSLTDYLLNAGLIFLVVRQMRDRELDLRSALLPLVLVFTIGQNYLTSLPTAGNDLLLAGGLALIGLTLGILSGFATSVRPGDNGHAIARVGWGAAFLLLIGIGARMAFVFAVNNGAGHAITSFSSSAHITAAAWPVALVSMAVLEVVVRVVIVQLRGRHAMATRRPGHVPVAVAA
jgi:hypothetical protein